MESLTKLWTTEDSLEVWKHLNISMTLKGNSWGIRWLVITKGDARTWLLLFDCLFWLLAGQRGASFPFAQLLRVFPFGSEVLQIDHSNHIWWKAECDNIPPSCRNVWGLTMYFAHLVTAKLFDKRFVTRRISKVFLSSLVILAVVMFQREFKFHLMNSLPCCKHLYTESSYTSFLFSWDGTIVE